MAINSEEISAIFKALMSDIKNILDTEYAKSKIDNRAYETIVLESIRSAQQNSVELYLKYHAQLTQDALVEQQIDEIEKQVELIEQQIAESKSRVSIASAQSTKDLATKDAKIALTNRQNTALDDARNVKKAEALGNVISLIESGGTNAPEDTWTDFNDAIADI